MEVKNAVMPNDQQMAGFLEEGEDKPIFMVLFKCIWGSPLINY